MTRPRPTLTTREFFDRVVNNSQVLRNRMPGLVVKTRVPSFDFRFGVTPFPREAYVSDGAPVTSPLISRTNSGTPSPGPALDLNSAPINPATDYSHPLGSPLGGLEDSREFSKAAFLRTCRCLGIGVGIWFQPYVLYHRDSGIFEYEVPGVIADRTVALDLEPFIDAHEFPFCHTAAVRDLLDNSGTDGRRPHPG